MIKKLRNWWYARLRRIDVESLLPHIINESHSFAIASMAWKIHFDLSPHWIGHQDEAVSNLIECWDLLQ